MADNRTKYDNFELLVGRHRGLIRRLCWWRLLHTAAGHGTTGDDSLCDDLVQECYLAMWEHYDTLRPDVAKLQEVAWVVWQCRSVFSHSDRTDDLDRLPDLSDLSDLHDLSDLSDSATTREILDDLAQHLTPDEQRLFALMRQDLTDLEIAERLHLKPRTIREKQRQIIEKLRNNFGSLRSKL